jgi:hypothetical protein
LGSSRPHSLRSNIFGILKIIFDHSRELKPLGFLIGYERPGSGEDFFEKLKKKIKK